MNPSTILSVGRRNAFDLISNFRDMSSIIHCVCDDMVVDHEGWPHTLHLGLPAKFNLQQIWQRHSFLESSKLSSVLERLELEGKVATARSGNDDANF